MKLYIANCTRQVQHFMYRLPEQETVRQQQIEIGSQIRVSGELTTQDIDYIVEQHAKYGLVRSDEVDRTKPFIGMCYAVDKPIAVDKIRYALDHNRVILEDRGREMRQQAAIAVNNAMEQEAPGSLQALEMSVTEETKDGSDPTINEGTRVTRNEEPGPTESGGRTRSRRRSR